MNYYINYYFKEIIYDEKEIMGLFLSTDSDASCRFIYNRITQEMSIWDNNKPIEEIVPIPIHWLTRKLDSGEVLNENESKISY